MTLYGQSLDVSTRARVQFDTVDMGEEESVRRVFAASVAARTAGNVALRRYIESLYPSEHKLATAAVEGAASAGLRITAETQEAHLTNKVAAGELGTALELYRDLIAHRITPTKGTYSVLMRLCLERQSAAACRSLYQDMVRRGVQGDGEVYEYLLTSLAYERPVQWELAIEIFDRLNTKYPHLVTNRTYNGLMRVYLAMRPFEWRVCYNCYYEMRLKHQTLPLTWDSYYLVAEAMRLGRAPWHRRVLTFFDAFVNLTTPKDKEFWIGMVVFVVVGMTLKTVVARLLMVLAFYIMYPNGGQEVKY